MKYIVPLLLCMVLAGCGRQSPLEVYSKPAEITIVQPSDPTPVVMQPVKWTLVTKDNIDSVVAQAKASQDSDGTVFVVLSTDYYKNLLLNIADLRRYIQQQQAIIGYYKQITTTSSSKKK